MTNKGFEMPEIGIMHIMWLDQEYLHDMYLYGYSGTVDTVKGEPLIEGQQGLQSHAWCNLQCV